MATLGGAAAFRLITLTEEFVVDELIQISETLSDVQNTNLWGLELISMHYQERRDPPGLPRHELGDRDQRSS